MNLKPIIIFAFILISGASYGQVPDSELYKTAYNYLNDSIINANYRNPKTFRNECKQYIKGVKLKFDSELQVATEFIEIDRGFPLCDLLKKKYKIKENCVYALGSGKFKLGRHVQDSLETFWQGYEMKNESEIAESLKDFEARRKDGYVVFFSDIYKNTLAAEVKSFCLPYDETAWFGQLNILFLCI